MICQIERTADSLWRVSNGSTIVTWLTTQQLSALGITNPPDVASIHLRGTVIGDWIAKIHTEFPGQIAVAPLWGDTISVVVKDTVSIIRITEDDSFRVGLGILGRLHTPVATIEEAITVAKKLLSAREGQINAREK